MIRAKVSYKDLGADARLDCDRLVIVMRHAEPTAFKYEGVAIHALRSGRCLSGWDFDLADAMARAIVRVALNRLRCVRPSLADAQAIPFPDGSRECVICTAPLYDNADAYCSAACRGKMQTIRESRLAAEARAELKCLACHAPLDAKSSKRRYCSHRCKATAEHRSAPTRTCLQCGNQFQRHTPPSRPAQQFCGRSCATRWQRRQHGVGPRKLRAGSAETGGCLDAR